MLPNINRLTSKKDFDEVFKKGKSFKGDFLIFKILKNTLQAPRFGFVVSKKISTKATVRNKVKRMLRAAVAGYIKENMKPVDLVIITLPNIKNKGFPEIKETVSKFLKKY